KVLTRSLNKLNEDDKFIGYGMPKWSEKINHLSYADDTILFCSGHKESVKKMLNKYEKISDSLWMWNKYCKKQHTVIAQGTGISHVWRKMIQIREEVEHNIWWQVKASFWFDNWTKQGALYYLEEQNHAEEEIEVKQFIQEGRWNKGKLNQYVSEEMVQYITENISPVLIETGRDKAWWTGNTTGNFMVKSA
ncbi:hypothetical protein H5410_019660, partial [Solanum commersonii]